MGVWMLCPCVHASTDRAIKMEKKTKKNDLGPQNLLRGAADVTLAVVIPPTTAVVVIPPTSVVAVVIPPTSVVAVVIPPASVADAGPIPPTSVAAAGIIPPTIVAAAGIIPPARCGIIPQLVLLLLAALVFIAFVSSDSLGSITKKKRFCLFLFLATLPVCEPTSVTSSE